MGKRRARCCASTPSAHQRQPSAAACCVCAQCVCAPPCAMPAHDTAAVCVCPPGARSYDISTIASVIPAFASRQDLLVVDDGVAYPIQQVGHTQGAAQGAGLYLVCEEGGRLGCSCCLTRPGSPVAPPAHASC